MYDILRGTPLWVYAVFLILTYYGVSACFKSHVSRRSLQFTPAVFVAISLVSLNFSQGAAIPLSVYALGMLAGWVLASRFYSYQGVVRDGERLILNGTVKLLLVYWGFFAWRYYSGYQEAMSPELVDGVSAIATSALASGIINGLIVGRSLRLLRFFKADTVSRVPL